MADDFLYGMARQGLADTQRDLKICWKALQDAKSRIAELESKLEKDSRGWEIAVDMRDVHLAGEQARNRYLMSELDRISGGKENNPARKQGCDPNKVRIPSGARKGEVVTVADKVYLAEFKGTFERKYAKVWKSKKNWLAFLHPRISY